MNKDKAICQGILGDNGYWRVNKKLATQYGFEVAIALADLINVEDMLERDGKLPKDGWFFQSRDDVETHTGMNRNSQTKAYAKLRTLKFIEQINKGIPRRRWFKIDYESLTKFLLGEEDDD